MNKFVGTSTSVTTILACGLAAVAIGLAATATAAPAGPNDNGGDTGQQDSTADADGWLDDGGMTPYGTYQNDDPRKSASHR